KSRPSTPPELGYLVKRCLAKDPKQRLQTARDLLRHLQWISQGGDQTGVTVAGAVRARKRNRLLWAVTSAVLLLTVVMAPSAYRLFGGTSELGEVRFVIANMPGTNIGSGATPPAVSPDGRWIVAGRTTGSNGGVWVLQLGSVYPKLILEGITAFSLYWSPDSH